MGKNEGMKKTFRVRAVDSTHIFYGDECPALQGASFRLNPGDPPVDISAGVAEYFDLFPGLRVDILSHNIPIDQED